MNYYIRFSCLLLALSFWQCEPNPSSEPVVLPTKAQSAIFDWVKPIILEEGETTLYLEDYFKDVVVVDSISADKALTTKLSDDKKTLVVEHKGDLPSLSILTIYGGEFAYDLLVKKSLKREVEIKVSFEDEPKKVALMGDLNNWNPANTPMTQNGNDWTVKLLLNPGRYPYLVVKDGESMLDPGNDKQLTNGMGGFNSLLVVEKPEWSSLPKLITNKTELEAISIKTFNNPEQLFAFWQNHLLETGVEADGTVTLLIPKEAKQAQRSFIRVYAYNQVGLSNDLLIPLQNGKVLTDVNDIKRQDKEAMTMYFTLIDRFKNGDPENDKPLEDERLTPIQNYNGGDLVGITQKIEDGYFKSLGINTLWLSPLTQNPLEAYQEFPKPNRWYSGYHGYWPISSSEVDFRFGTDDELTKLVETAHENGINVLLDYVCNHVHEEHPIYQKHPEWVTPLVLPDGTKNIRIWDEQRLTTWFDTFLPTLDLSKPEVVDIQTDSAMYWIKKFNLDGFRHDATKHVQTEFWRTLTRKLKEEVMFPNNKSIYQIGETFGSHELISSYINSGLLDAQFDFNLYFNARDVFAKDDESFERLAIAARESFDYYGYHSTMGNITGNHDLTRFMGLASGAVTFEEDPKEAGYERDVQVKDTLAYQKLSGMTAFLMTMPGIPVIFYGDEIGMVGAGDPDNRRMMRFEDLNKFEAKTKETADKLGQLRRSNLSLTYGDFELISADTSTLVYARHYFNKTSVVAFNKGEARTLEFELPIWLATDGLMANFGHEVRLFGEKVEVALSKNGFEILTN